jgi:hypothetical protein
MRSFVGRRPQPAGYLIGKIDVSWRTEVVTGDENGRKGAGTLVRDPVPGGAPEHDGVTPVAAVGGSDDLSCAAAPGFDDAVDRRG